MNYDEIIAKNAAEMRPSGIRKFFDLAAQIEGCISLGVGEPDFQTPWVIRDAAIASLEAGKTKYTANAGLIQLRRELCEYVKRKFGLVYYPNEVLVTVGGSEAIDLAMRAILEPGDEVIIPEPCYVSYEPIAQLIGARIKHVPTYEKDNFRLHASAIKEAITDKTKILVLSYPNNPTGAVLTKEDLNDIADVIRDTNIIVLADEIYAELVYGHKHTSIAAIPGMREHTIVVTGFSKTFSMTGWRLGYALGPEPLIQLMTKIHQSCIMAAPTTSQYAALTALKECDDEVEAMRSEYDMRRRFMVNRLNVMGLSTFEPQGAFYVFPRIADTGMSSQEFCARLLESKKVAIIPGDAFGQCGEGYARISYAYGMDHLREALQRMEEFLKEIDYGN